MEQMTLTEARAIVRRFWDWTLPDDMWREARAIVQAAKPVVEYATVDSEADDRAFESGELEYELGHDGVGRVQL
jgi:hypothetical protein